MSKVDMSVFEEVKASSGYTSLTEMIYNMCEGDFYPTTEDMLECNYPDYKLKSTDLAEYYKQYGEYKEISNKNSCIRQEYKDFIGYKHISQDGGGEGGSEACEGIFQLKGKAYRAHYSYYSYNGHEYDYIVDTLEEVKPVQKMITVYESV